MIQICIEIDDAVFQRARMRAIAEGTSVSEIGREFLVQYAWLDGTNESAMPELSVFQGGTGLRHGIDPSSNKSLLIAIADLEDKAQGRFNTGFSI